MAAPAALACALRLPLPVAFADFVVIGAAMPAAVGTLRPLPLLDAKMAWLMLASPHAGGAGAGVAGRGVANAAGSPAVGDPLLVRLCV